MKFLIATHDQAGGGFLLVNHKEDIGDFFEPGKEVATYRNREELRHKIEHYFSQPEKTSEMARKAMNGRSGSTRIVIALKDCRI